MGGARERLPRPPGLAQGPSAHADRVSAHRGISPGGTLRLDHATATVKIAANLAEGCGRNGDAELARFCAIAMGSASELEYHLLLARDLQLITPTDHSDMALRTTEVKRMLAGLIQKLTADR